MASENTPLLVESRGPLARSDGRTSQDGALQGITETTGPNTTPWTGRMREVLLFAWAFLATAGVIILAVVMQHNHGLHDDDGRQHEPSPVPPGPGHDGKRNLIFMVSDGMGPASLTLTRSFRQLTSDLAMDDTLTLDRHFWGTSRTRSSNSLVTDSAAGATAFSCANKSYNGAISVLPDLSACGTVLEAAKRAGYMTGLVATTDVTDATPACFASHVLRREQESEIALQEVGEGVLGRTVDVMLGGGRCHFLPARRNDSCRSDDVDVTRLAREKHGWSYVDDRAGFDALARGSNVSLPLLGLFAEHALPFEVDRRHMSHVYPSLSEMAATALGALDEATRHSDKGFFIMIEGSRIDHAGHYNDAAAQVREVLEYDKTMKLVLQYLDESETDGVMVATSDHETGGLALAYQYPSELPVYDWYPSVLARANASAEYVAFLLREHVHAHAHATTESATSLARWINTHLVVGRLGITDATRQELDALASSPDTAAELFARMVSLRARVGWSSHGHSAVDVNIYSSGGPGTDRIRGNVENTHVGRFLQEYLHVDVQAITAELRHKMVLRPPADADADTDTDSVQAAEAKAVEQANHATAWNVEP